MPKTYNKFVIGNTTYLDLSNDTVTADKILEGYTAHDKNGAQITGTAAGQSLIINDTTDEHGGIIREITGKVVQLKTKSITQNGTYNAEDEDYDGYSSVTVNVGGGGPNLQTKSVSYTPTTSAISDTVVPDSGYDGLDEVDVSISAIPTGTAGTPTATKGTVSNHAVSVTPSVTNTTGYISGGTKTGTAVSVSASELVSGTYSVTSSGTKDVTNYASASVPSGSATAAASISGTSATVSTGTNTLTLSKTVSNTPQVTAGYISSGTAGNSSVSLTASVTTKAAATITPGTSNQTIASGTYLTGTQTISGDSDLIAGNIKKNVQIFGVTGTYEGGGGSSMNCQVAQSTSRANTTGYTEVISLTCSVSGTYDVYWSTFRSSTSSTWGSQLYINDTAYGTADTGNWSNHIQNKHLTNVKLSANDEVAVRVRSRGSNYYGYVGTLTIKQTS